MREYIFSEYRVAIFHERGCGHPFLNGYCIYPLSTNPTKWSNILKQFVGNLPTNSLSVFGHFMRLALKGLRRALQQCEMYMQCIWQIFLFQTFFYFRDALAVIHFSGTVIISGGFFSDLVFLRMLCYFETSTYSHPYFQSYWVNSSIQLYPSI